MRLENLADIQTECFSLHQAKTCRIHFCTDALSQNIGKIFQCKATPN